jgi:hypothetical protein
MMRDSLCVYGCVIHDKSFQVVIPAKLVLDLIGERESIRI